MIITFEIIKLINHHNRGQFIFVRQLKMTEPLNIHDGALLNGFPICHYTEMYPFSREGSVGFDIYVFRPIALNGYPKGFFQEGQIVELAL